MATPQDLQELIRLMTVGMKVPMKETLVRIKALQAKNLRSIQQIAQAALEEVESAIEDTKAARSLQNACKARLKNPILSSSSTGKRTGTTVTSMSKRPKTSDENSYVASSEPIPPHEYEASLDLPVKVDEGVIASTVLSTNRAPLVLAFAVELLRYTMPEQPPSSRLSLAQAVVSANSRSKAVSIGLEKGPSADDDGWGQGQPRVKVMGREVSVLKRGGYNWRREEYLGSDDEIPAKKFSSSLASSITLTGASQARPASQQSASWNTSQTVSLKKSVFIVRATHLADPSQRQSAMQSLFAAVPALKDATHNAWAYRVSVRTNLFDATTVREASFDDGESGCGDFLLKNMREMNAIDTLVVMSRWYGGIMLGPDRWRIMRNCLKESLAERLRVAGELATLGGEALWGLDLEAMRNKSSAAGTTVTRSYNAGVIGMPIHRPESARAYLLKSFATRLESSGDETGTPGRSAELQDDEGFPRRNSSSTSGKVTRKKRTAKELEVEKEENVSRLLGAIRVLYGSWADHLNVVELDGRAWNWYVAVRPEVESGPAGWGAKGHLRLSDILALRRKE